MATYYNEIDPYCVQWLKNLIAGGLIPDGEVDSRSICDVRPDDLVGYAQCHFFAGIGGWAYALQLSGWGDRPAWTGSCPCQPFSVAGRRKAQSDERHLWPEWFRLIRAGRPKYVFGEQVANAIGHGWLDGVFGDLEAEGYIGGAAVLGAHSVGAPHIRQRLYWVGHANSSGCTACDSQPIGTGARPKHTTQSGVCCGLADSLSPRLEEWQGEPGDAGTERAAVERDCDAGGLAESECPERRADAEYRADDQHEVQEREQGPGGLGERGELGGMEHPKRDTGGPGRVTVEPTEGIRATGERSPIEPGRPSMPWDDYDLIPCLDGKARRAPKFESGVQPLAYGATARMGRLRAYGNAIVAPLAAEFVRTCMELKL